MIKAFEIERMEYLEFKKKCFKEVQKAHSFMKYECNRYGLIVNNENSILS